MVSITLACDARGMVGGWTGTCPSGHKKWAWSWHSSKHRKIYLQICREMGSHTVSIMAWEDDCHPSQRSVFGAGSLNLCYRWQESWDENISTKTVRTINKISVFCKFIYFDWMSVYVFKYLFLFNCRSASISSVLQTFPGSFPPDRLQQLNAEPPC